MSFFYNFSYIFSFAFCLFPVRDATMFFRHQRYQSFVYLFLYSFIPLLTFHLPLYLCVPVSISVSYWYFVLFCFQTFCLLHLLFTIHYSLFIIHLVLFTSTIDISIYLFILLLCLFNSSSIRLFCMFSSSSYVL